MCAFVTAFRAYRPGLNGHQKGGQQPSSSKATFSGLQGLRTYVCTNYTETAKHRYPAIDSEHWGFYPDDKPLRSFYEGDTRAALVPFLAHRDLGDTFKWLFYGAPSVPSGGSIQVGNVPNELSWLLSTCVALRQGLVAGDDDTILFLDAAMKLVKDLDPEMPYFLTGQCCRLWLPYLPLVHSPSAVRLAHAHPLLAWQPVVILAVVARASVSSLACRPLLVRLLELRVPLPPALAGAAVSPLPLGH